MTSEVFPFTFTRDPIRTDSVSLVTLTVITAFCVTAHLLAVVIPCCAFILIWRVEREKLKLNFTSNVLVYTSSYVSSPFQALGSRREAKKGGERGKNAFFPLVYFLAHLRFSLSPNY